MWTLLYPHGRPTSTQAPQTCSQIASLFSTSTWNLPLVLESRLNLLKELTSLGAISLPTAQPHSHHTPSFRFSSHSGLYSAPSPQDLCTYCSLCLGHLLSLLALVNSCSSFKSFSEKVPDLPDQVKRLHWHHKPLLQSPITQHVSIWSVWLMTWVLPVLSVDWRPCEGRALAASGKCLVHSRCSIHTCWVNEHMYEWANEWMSPFRSLALLKSF